MKKNTMDFPSFFIGIIVVAYFSLHLGYALNTNSQLPSAIESFNHSIMKSPFIFKDSILNLAPMTLTFEFFYTIFWISYIETNKKFRRKGQEHGSSSWGNIAETFKLRNKKKFENFILSKNIFLSKNSQAIKKNLNSIVFGGAGTGKSRYVLTPNIMQANTSYVVIDPKGAILENVGKFLETKKYKIKIFNLVDMDLSHKYNPFEYLQKEEEIYILVDNLINNTSGGEEAKSNKGDPFWENAERALLSCVMSYLWYKAPPEQQNFYMVLSIIQNFKNKDYKHIENIKNMPKESMTYINYSTIEIAEEKTLDSILVSAAIRLSLMTSPDVRNLLSTKDELEINKIGDEKTALFIIIPDTSATFNFIASILYNQIFQKLVYKADNSKNRKLKIHTRFLIDEFANIGQIPNIEKYIATVRSRNMSIMPILQDLSQLKNLYEKTWGSIIGNCDSFIFLGGTDPETLKYISERLGKETIYSKNRGTTKSKQRSVSYNEGLISRNLMNTDEIANLEDDKCIVFIRGHKPYLDSKFDLKKHSNYKYLGEVTNNNYLLVNYFKEREVSLLRPSHSSKAIIEKYKITDLTLTEEAELITIDGESQLIRNKILSQLNESGSAIKLSM
ncbi:VirD4-like conjugal transfer protein, CD1115 family [Clostridium cochlearium]|uniref:VirD4-like conjugal transfer protein, CD1115 family n=1 Tax=Clostridium cochlearium TaxID=1494 RepID=UPI00242045CC|nr:type IV secretory system conjugative DNA transfer family protein [Clostridium cochlearium]MBE6065915.1 type IV secretory system conjugative DNA transfer family protein [Clostridium cochlearium]